MKLMLVGDFPKDDKIVGGVQGVLLNLVNELINRSDIELVLIALNVDCDFKKFETHCKTYKLKFRTSFFHGRKIFNEIVDLENPDIIHLQGLVPGVLLYKKQYKNKFVVTQHAVLNEELRWQVSLKRKVLFRIKERIEKYYFKKIQNIIFISEYNKKVYFERFQKKKGLKFELIPNPVNDIFLHYERPIVPTNKNELYFVGEIKKRKGLHVLIQALHILIQQNLDCKLHLIGGFKESNYEKHINHLVKSLGLTKNVVFSGWKNQLEIMEYSKNIPVFVLPSFQETLPLSIAEAMCQGKIVVASNICGIPEMIEDNVSGYLFPPGNHQELANILKDIFSNIKKQKSVSEKAITTGRKFDSSLIVDKSIDFYLSLIN